MNLCKDLAAKIEELLSNAVKINDVNSKFEKLGDSGQIMSLVKEFIALRNKHKLLKKEAIPFVDEEVAKEILGEDFLGQEAVLKTFGVILKSEETPSIPFTEQDLKDAKERGEQLILRVDRAPDGEPLTMRKMNELLEDRLQKENKGKILYDVDWYKDEDFFNKDKVKLSWALVSKEVLPNSTIKNYLQQTEEVLIPHLDQVYGTNKPVKVQEAIAEFAKLKKDYPNLVQMVKSSDDKEWKKASELLGNLKLNQLFRRTPQEVLYDLLINIETTGKRLLESKYVWTNTRSSNGGLVDVGRFASDGAGVSRVRPDGADGYFGLSFVRSF